MNPRSSSTKMCHPIKFHFAKETGAKTVGEVDYVTNEIKNLPPSYLTTNDSHIPRTVSNMDLGLVSFDSASKYT